MNKNQEKLLVATLCGLVITAAGAFAVQPAIAAGHTMDGLAQVTGMAEWDRLSVRLEPAPDSQKIGAFTRGSHVWVERCLESAAGVDWCLVDANDTKGWVNFRYLTVVEDRDI